MLVARQGRRGGNPRFVTRQWEDFGNPPVRRPEPDVSTLELPRRAGPWKSTWKDYAPVFNEPRSPLSDYERFRRDWWNEYWQDEWGHPERG